MRALAITQYVTLDGAVDMLDGWFDAESCSGDLLGEIHPTVLGGDPVAEARALKELPGEDIVVTGSIRQCHSLITAGLVDEYRLFVCPVVQGHGRRLFPDGFACSALRLLEATYFDDGIAYVRYAAS